MAKKKNKNKPLSMLSKESQGEVENTSIPISVLPPMGGGEDDPAGVISDKDLNKPEPTPMPPVVNKQVNNTEEHKLTIRKDVHVLIGAPCYGAQIKECFFQSIMKMVVEFMKLGVSFTIKTISCESLIVRARNYFAAYVSSKPEFTHLLFIDTDIQFSPHDVLRLIAIDKDIACAPYPKKYVDWNSVYDTKNEFSSVDEMKKNGIKYVINFNTDEEDQNVKKTDNNQLTIKVEKGFIKVKDSGTGFMLINKRVFERMRNEYKDIELYKNNIDMYADADPKNFYTYFDCIVDPSSGFYLSEDYAFCRKWQIMGGEIWLDTNSTLGHYGDYMYIGGSFMERFKK